MCTIGTCVIPPHGRDRPAAALSADPLVGMMDLAGGESAPKRGPTKVFEGGIYAGLDKGLRADTVPIGPAPSGCVHAPAANPGGALPLGDENAQPAQDFSPKSPYVSPKSERQWDACRGRWMCLPNADRAEVLRRYMLARGLDINEPFLAAIAAGGFSADRLWQTWVAAGDETLRGLCDAVDEFVNERRSKAAPGNDLEAVAEGKGIAPAGNVAEAQAACLAARGYWMPANAAARTPARCVGAVPTPGQTMTGGAGGQTAAECTARGGHLDTTGVCVQNEAPDQTPQILQAVGTSVLGIAQGVFGYLRGEQQADLAVRLAEITSRQQQATQLAASDQAAATLANLQIQRDIETLRAQTIAAANAAGANVQTSTTPPWLYPVLGVGALGILGYIAFGRKR